MCSKSLTLLFVVFAVEALAQTYIDVPINDPTVGSFNVQVRHFTPPDIGTSQFKCIGILFSLRHVLTVAGCVANQPVEKIILVVGSTSMDYRTDKSETQLLEKVTIHPNYTDSQPLVANVAVLTVSELDSSRFIPRTLSASGLLMSDINYAILGYLGLSQTMTSYFISIQPPTICDVAQPQAYCSVDRLSLTPTCGGYLGAPMFTASADTVYGIVIQDRFCNDSTQYGGNFHSMHDFRDWILETSGASENAKVAAFLLVSTVLISLRHLVQ